jgi:hypothetical protein
MDIILNAWREDIHKKLTVTQLVTKSPPLLWIPNVAYCVHKNSKLVPILSLIYPVHTLLPFPKVRYNSSEWFFFMIDDICKVTKNQFGKCVYSSVRAGIAQLV